MANAPAVWWSDGSMSGSMSRSYTSRSSLGPRSAGTAEVPFAIEPLDPATTPSRSEPTALRYKTTPSPSQSHVRSPSFRRGAVAPEKSSLPFFVLVGLVVGLFAFGMMTFCLPDPMEQMAAREAKAAQTFPPPPPIPAYVAPVAPVEVLPAQAVVTTIAPIEPIRTAKTAHTVRRETRAKKKTATLPSNPYAN